MFDTSRIHPMLDKVQTYLGLWLEDHLKQIRPADWWERCVMDVLVPEQRENVLNDGANNPSGLDLSMQISVFRGNWQSLRRRFHLSPQLYDDAIAVKRIRNKYSHKKSSEDYDSRFEHDMETVRLFLKGLGAPDDMIDTGASTRDTESSEAREKTEHAMTFDSIIESARVALPANVRRAPWIGLEHGVVPLDTEQKLNQYLAAYGKMHTEKIRMALDSLDNLEHLLSAPVSVIDWGCGQALATCCFLDWSRKNEIDFDRISHVHLIEPSELALRRAQTNIISYKREYNCQFDTKTTNKFIGDIQPDDFEIRGINTTLHFFSNVLDIETVNLDSLAQFIKSTFTGRQIFCCVGPLNNGASRIMEFAEKFGITQEQIEARCQGKLAHCKGTIAMLTFVVDEGISSVRKAAIEPMAPPEVSGNITLQRLLKRYEPSQNTVDRILQFYLMSTELEQLKEPDVDRSTPFVMTDTGAGVQVSFKDNCLDPTPFAKNCKAFVDRCKKNADPQQTKWPKDLHFALEVAWGKSAYRLLYATKPVSELMRFDYEHGEISLQLNEFSVDLALAEKLEISDEKIAEVEHCLHSANASLTLLGNQIKGTIDQSAQLNTAQVYLSLCEKQIALAQTYAELKKMDAHSICRNSLLEAFIEHAEFGNVVDSVSPDELISAVPMDVYQRNAIANAINNHVSVVVGPPGCGKTQLLLNLLANALVRGKKVLVASKNNKAVDNVVERFERFDVNGCFLRFGSKNYLRDTTCPKIAGLLNLAQEQNYDDAPYQESIEQFYQAKAGIKRKEGLEEERDRSNDELLMASQVIPELEAQLANAQQQMDAILPEFCVKARAFLNDELKRLQELINETDAEIDKVNRGIEAEPSRLKHEVEEFDQRNGIYVSLNGIESSELSQLALALRKMATDVEYRVAGLRGILVRVFGKTKLAKEVLDLFVDVSIKIRNYLNRSDSRSSIKDFLNWREICEFCRHQADALDAVILNYREPLAAIRRNSDEKIAQMRYAVKEAKSKIADMQHEVNEIRIVVSDGDRLSEYAQNKYILPIEECKRRVAAQIEEIKERINENEKLRDNAYNHIQAINTQLMEISTLATNVFSVEFGRKLVALTLNHYLHVNDSARAIAAYKSYMPENMPRRHEDVQSFVVATKRFLEVCRLVSVTSLSVKNAFPRADGLFDMLVIDEASQCDVASALPLIQRAKQIVIIGDPMQLRHISKINPEEELAIKRHLNLSGATHLKYSEESLWDYTRSWLPWCGNDAPCVLENHYRCHPDIIGYSNNMFYRTLAIGGLNVCTPQVSGCDQGVVWVDVQQSSDTGKRNDAEARQAVAIAQKYALKHASATIGIVTPFNAQAEKINALIPANLRNRTIADTVHKFQGDEKDIMIYSLVVTDDSPDGRIRWVDYIAPNLVNVAVTRAKRLLVIIGNRNYIKTHSRTNLPLGYLESYVSAIEARNTVNANNR